MKQSLSLQKKEAFTFLHLPSSGEVVRIHLTIQTAFLPKDFLKLAFLGDMLERGSAKYTKDVYEEKLELLGAQVDIATNGSNLDIDITARAQTIDEVLAIVIETFSSPAFLPEEIEKLKKEYAQHLHEEEDNSRSLAYTAFTQKIYSEHEEGYVATLSVRKKYLAKCTKEALVAAHQNLFQAPWVLSIASDAQAAEFVHSQISRIHKGGILGEKDKKNSPSVASAVQEYLFVREKQNVELFIGNRLPLTLEDTDFLAFAFGLDVLGKRGGFAGRLMSTVREKEGLTYSIYAWIRGATATLSGHWNISTFFTAKDTPQGITSTLREVKLIIEKGVSDIEVRRFKELLTNQFRLAHESDSSVLSLYHSALVAGRTLENVAEYPKRISLLTKKEINRALQKYIDLKKLIIVGAGPTKELQEKKVEKN